MEILKIKKKPEMNCMVCGKELIYTQNYENAECYFCNKKFIVNVACPDGHFVCDGCHAKDALTLIEDSCINSKETNPMVLTNELLKNSKIAMHGPEHHFLVPAVLICTYYNIIGDIDVKREKISIAKTRAKSVPGGSCGYNGNCGAAVGTGIFMSVITETTPLSKETFGMCSEVTGKTLIKLSKMGGPRCCKRSVYTAILEASNMVYEKLGVKMLKNEDRFICDYSKFNKECIGSKCSYNKVNFLDDVYELSEYKILDDKED